jgi:ribosomal protein S18 acetylase RimI-like enzyme
MEIVPTGAGGPELEPILQDYRRHYHLTEETVLSTLLEAVATRRAQALVALSGSQPVGAIVVSLRGAEGQIRLLHALEDVSAAKEALLDRAEETLRQAGAQTSAGTLPLGPEDRLAEVLRQRGYQVIPRARMVLQLDRWTAPSGTDLPPGYSLSSWQVGLQDAVAVLLDEAHQNSVDVAIYPELAGVEGARRLLQGLGEGVYGRFDPALAPVATVGQDLAGLSLNVWHAALPEQGFILDLAVAAAHRRRGLGRALVVATARAFREASAVALGLAVTLANRPAVQLYAGLGFQVEQHFSVVHKDLRQ